MPGKIKAPRNRTIELSSDELDFYKENFFRMQQKQSAKQLENKIICGDLFKISDFLPDSFVDLLFIDPPYNLQKKFNSISFKKMKPNDYESWIDQWLGSLAKILKPDASIYICCDWKSSTEIFNAAQKYFIVQNRITWEREKGRGSKRNWKNSSEDIWFFTMSRNYTFNLEDVKLKRKVIAPYKENGKPKDWNEGEENFRITHPSNLWTDITIPFWSMPENTEHPTQKPEKLLAKIILASSNPGDLVFDPFLGSGTTAVTAKKLGRKYCGVELDEYFCGLAEKRLKLADEDNSIQGYEDGIFWERNSLQHQKKKK